MDNFLVPSDPKYFSSVCRQISKKSRSTWNRLLSIFCDAQFIRHLTQTIKLPIIANLRYISSHILQVKYYRCGIWYCQDYIDQCYFKSTDGHQGKWSFSLSRLNLHLMDVMASNGGVIIVDATRKGKLFPVRRQLWNLLIEASILGCIVQDHSNLDHCHESSAWSGL